jgi:hypothetical protein
MKLGTKLQTFFSPKNAKPKKRAFSRARDLNVLRFEKRVGVEKFLAASPEFMQKYGDKISVASQLILSNMKKLKEGQVVEKYGFVMKAARTGEYAGRNTELSLCVSFKGKTFFVKIGEQTNKSAAIAYKKAKEFLAINNRFNGYTVELVPYHLLYSNSRSSNLKKRGFLVSDFFSSSEVSLGLDIRKLEGDEKFHKSHLGKAIRSVREGLNNLGVFDVGSHNCFVSKSEKKIYFFDLHNQ